MREKFFSCYDEVFDEYGNIKSCGRENCIRLIEAAESLPGTRSGQFGSNQTGFMDKQEIFKLYITLILD